MKSDKFTLVCPSPVCRAPLPDQEIIQLAHGGGGRMMNRLIETLFLEGLQDDALASRHDGAVLDLGDARLAFTTDSFVVQPIFFPGGDIGTLAVNGTVNDLAMCGARPLYMSAAFILEEGLPIGDLRRVVSSMRRAAAAAGIQLVTGDTKVVDRGKGDQIFVNTTGIGRIDPGVEIHPRHVRPGDRVLVSGDLARHGMAVMAVREGLGFESAIESDCAPLAAPVLALIEAGIDVHCLRDLTRGGLASALVEIAEASGLGIAIEENAILVRDDVRAACELLGFDPIYVANEGRFVAFVSPNDAERALVVIKEYPDGAEARMIGEVTAGPRAQVTMESLIGGARVIDMLSGEQLPRIC